ncbi:hypothetical protein BCR44DRAFT_294264, partial [Catenaria anguillulae PL171]
FVIGRIEGTKTNAGDEAAGCPLPCDGPAARHEVHVSHAHMPSDAIANDPPQSAMHTMTSPPSPYADPTFLLDTDPQPTPPPIASSPPLHPSAGASSSLPQLQQLDLPAWNSTTRLLAHQTATHLASLERAAVRDRLASDPMAQHAIASAATRQALNTSRSGRMYARGSASGIPVLVDAGKVNAKRQRRAEPTVDEAYLNRVKDAKPTVAHFMGPTAQASSSPNAEHDFDYLLATVPLLKSIPRASSAATKHPGRPQTADHVARSPASAVEQPVFIAHDVLTFQADGFADEY